MNIILHPVHQNKITGLKLGFTALVSVAKEFQAGRVNERALEVIVNKAADSLSNQLVLMEETSELRHLTQLATNAARHSQLLNLITAQKNQLLNLVNAQKNQLARANEIIEKLVKENPGDFIKMLQDGVTAYNFKVFMDDVLEWLKTTKGKVTLAVLLISIIRIMDTLIFGGLLTRGTVGTVRGTGKVGLKAIKFLFKKMTNTASACKKVVYFIILALYMLTFRKKRSPGRVVLNNNRTMSRRVNLQPSSRIRNVTNNAPPTLIRSRNAQSTRTKSRKQHNPKGA